MRKNKATALSAFEMYEFHGTQQGTMIQPGQTLFRYCRSSSNAHSTFGIAVLLARILRVMVRKGLHSVLNSQKKCLIWSHPFPLSFMLYFFSSACYF